MKNLEMRLSWDFVDLCEVHVTKLFLPSSPSLHFAKRSPTGGPQAGGHRRWQNPHGTFCLAHTDYYSPSILGIPSLCSRSRGCSGVQMAEGNMKQPLGTEFQYEAFEEMPGENKLFFHAEV